MAAAFFDRFVQSLVPGSMVADLGCGPGHDARRLIETGHAVLAIDIARGLLRLCPDTAHTTLGDLRLLPLVDGGVSAIWCSAALLHVDRADLEATFAEWDRALAPGGIVGFATSMGGDEGWELVPAGAHRRPEIAEGDQRWFVHHTQEFLESAVTNAGWDITWSAARSSHREWLQVLATKPG